MSERDILVLEHNLDQNQKMMESGAHFCNSCGEQIGLDANGEVFVACHECYFPICKACFEYEINEGRKVCLRCATPYAGNPPMFLFLQLSCHSLHFEDFFFFTRDFFLFKEFM